MSENILTIREVADLLKINEKTVYKLAAASKIPGVKVGGSWRFDRTTISAWISTKSGADMAVPNDGPADGPEQSLSTARVDMNPHQVDAALFALASPLSKGVLLADEVGLGKTIEASLVIAQRWAERRRRILLIVPKSLIGQWQSELLNLFNGLSTVGNKSSCPVLLISDLSGL